jgi:hypothetical protein
MHPPPSRSAHVDLARRGLALHWLLLLGVTVLALAATADLIYHSLPPDLALSLQPLLGEQGLRAHLAMFGGMLLMVAGLVRMGVAQ